MILFWSLAAGLVALAFLFVLLPLLSRRARDRDPDRNQLTLALFRRQLRELDLDLAAGALDQRQYQAARGDLERELLRDVEETATQDPPDTAGGRRRIAGLLAALLPAVAIPLYLYLGNSALIPHLEAAATADAGAPAVHPGPDGNPPSLEVMIRRLADKLERNPDNLEGWMILGRTYFAIGQPHKARYALEQAHRLGPDNPDVLVAYAEAIAAGNRNELAGRPAELIREALKIDPKHTGARWLEGLISFQIARYDRAAEQWAALAVTLDPDSEEAAELGRYIAEAHRRAGPDTPGGRAQTPARTPAETGTGAEQAPPPGLDTQATTAPRPTAATAGAIRIEVSLAESLRSRTNPNDPVFIYAKSVSGPPMPLAARRARVADLPATLILDDSLALDQARKLSAFPEVTLVARISRSGKAKPHSGDPEGEVGKVRPGQADTVRLLIDRVRP